MWSTYIDNVTGLLNGSLGIEGEAGVDFGRDLARNDLQNLLAELDEETVKSSIDLLVDAAALSGV